MQRGAFVLLAACGRLGFEATPDRDAAVVIDSASVDAASLCATAFCDGFEDPLLLAWPGGELNGGSTVVRDAAFGHRGASLHATGPAGSDIAVRSAQVFATTPNEIWVRAFIYSPSGFVLDFEPLELADAGTTHSLVMSLYDAGADVHTHGFPTDFIYNSDAVTPRDRWVCYEIQIVLGASGSIALYQDGTALIGAPAIAVTPPNNDLTHLRVGIASKPVPTAENMFADEVAVGPVRFGCD